MATKPTTLQKFFAVLNRQLTENGKAAIDPTEFGTPVPQAYTGTLYQRNSFVVMDPPIASSIVGRITVMYDRIDFTQFTGIRVEKGAATTLLQLLPAISEAIGIEFTVNDFNNVTLPASGTMTLVASPGNILFTGNLTFELVV